MNKCTTANIKYRYKNTYLFQFVYYCSFLLRLETVKMYITYGIKRKHIKLIKVNKILEIQMQANFV